MKRKAFALLAGLLLLSLLPGPALATNSIVDQSNSVTDISITNSAINAQTFTAGIYGPLTNVDLYLRSSGANVTVMLENTVGSPPKPLDGTLATTHASVSTSEGPAWIRFYFSNNPIVIPGHVYAIVIFATANADVFGSVANAYPRGQAWSLRNLAWTPEPAADSGGPADWSFRAMVGPASRTPTPTPRPTATHAPTATPTPTPTATPTPTDTPTATPTNTPTATTTPTATEAPTASAPPAAPLPAAGSSGSTDLTIPIFSAVVLVLLIGGLAFLLLRKRRAGPTQGPGGPPGQVVTPATSEEGSQP
jgi:hypothetical protein